MIDLRKQTTNLFNLQYLNGSKLIETIKHNIPLLLCKSIAGNRKKLGITKLGAYTAKCTITGAIIKL